MVLYVELLGIRSHGVGVSGYEHAVHKFYSDQSGGIPNPTNRNQTPTQITSEVSSQLGLSCRLELDIKSPPELGVS